MLTGDDLRTAATRLAWFAVGGAIGGRRTNDPIALDVTERRRALVAWPHGAVGYSSCGDLPNWLLFRLGCRDRRLNRAENHSWVVGHNLSALEALGARKASIEDAKPGDIAIMHASEWRAHTFVFERIDTTTDGSRVVRSYDYGQAAMLSTVQGVETEGCYRTRRIEEVTDVLLLDLESVPLTAPPELGEAYAARFGMTYV